MALALLAQVEACLPDLVVVYPLAPEVACLRAPVAVYPPDLAVVCLLAQVVVYPPDLAAACLLAQVAVVRLALDLIMINGIVPILTADENMNYVL